MARIERCPQCHRRIVRSSEANRKYWAIVYLVADKLRPGGRAYSARTIHIYFKSRFLGCDDVRLPNGKTLTIPHSTANLDVGEFSDYLEKVQAWAAERGVFLSDMEAA